MEAPGVTKPDTDQSSNEKGILDTQLENCEGYLHDSQLPADPDAHLSAEEKTAIVSLPRLWLSWLAKLTLPVPRTENSCGSLT
jgi:hypothetical protein